MQSLSINSTNIQQTNNLFPFTKKVYQKVQHAWSYAGKSLLACRFSINAVLRSCRWVTLSCEKKRILGSAVLRLKLLSIVSVPLNLIDLPQLIRKASDNFHARKTKESFLTSLSIAILAADIFDSLTTFANAALELSSRATIKWTAALGLPLAYSMVLGGSVIRIIKIYDNSRETARIGNLYEQAMKEQTVDGERHAAKLEQLGTEKRVHIGSLTANAVTLAALASFSLPLAPAIPFVLLSTATLSRLALQAYQDRR